MIAAYLLGAIGSLLFIIGVSMIARDVKDGDNLWPSTIITWVGSGFVVMSLLGMINHFLS